MSEREDVEALAEAFHDAYERAAAGLGWETQERSRVPWADVPEANKETMRATLRAVMPAHDELVRADERKRLAGEVEAAREAIRVEMLAQPMTDGRDTYSDGYQQGLARAIDRIDAALVPVPGVRLTEEE